MLNTALRIQQGSWDELQQDAKIIREHVFIQEQQIAEADEWDAEDATALHFVVFLNAQAVATARLLTDHSIGRVAVLKEYRGLKIGQQLMQEIMHIALLQQRPFVKLSAQVYAIGFYQALGFKAEGEQYLDCGIPHIDMRYLF